MTEPLPYEPKAQDIAKYLGDTFSGIFERSGEDFAFVGTVAALYKKRGGHLDPSGSAFDDHGDPYSPEIWEYAYQDEFRRLMRRVLEILLENYGG